MSRRPLTPSRCLLVPALAAVAGCGGGVKRGASTAPLPPVAAAAADPLAAVRPPAQDYHRSIARYTGDALGDLPRRARTAPLKELLEYSSNARDQLFDHQRTPVEVLQDSRLITAECADAAVLEALIDRDDGTLDPATHDQLRDDLLDRYAELAFPDSVFETAGRQLDAETATGQPAPELAARRGEIARLKALAGYARAGLYALSRDALADKPQAHVLVRLGEDYRAQGDLTRAIASFRMALDLADSPEAEMMLAEALYAQGATATADALLATPLHADASNRARALRAAALARKLARSLTAGDAATVTRRVELLDRLGDFTKAVDAAENLVKLRPADPAAWAALSIAAWYDGRNPFEALAACRRGANVTPHAASWLAIKIVSEMLLLRQTPAAPAASRIADLPLYGALVADAKELAAFGRPESGTVWPILGELEALLARGEAHVATGEGASLLARVQAAPRTDPSTFGLDMVQLYLEMQGAAYRRAAPDLAAALPRLRSVASKEDLPRLDGLLLEAALEAAVRGDAAAPAQAEKQLQGIAAAGERSFTAFYRSQVSTAAWLAAPAGDRGAAAETALRDLAAAGQVIAADTALAESEQLSLLYPTLVNLVVLGTVQGQEIAEQTAKLLAQTPLARYPEALLAEGFAALHKGDDAAAQELFGLAAGTTPAVSLRAHRWLAALARREGDAARAAAEDKAAAGVLKEADKAAPYLWLAAAPAPHADTNADAEFLVRIATAYDVAEGDPLLPTSQLAVSASLLLVPDAGLHAAAAPAPASAPASAPRRAAARK